MALDWADRIAVWDRALQGVRATMRAAGLHEVMTPVRVPAPAVEPYIEPLRAPPRWLATSPELAMKRLLARGSGPIFQIAPVFRGGEVGAHHREEFHLVEWYRLGADLGPVLADVEALVGAVFDRVEPWRGTGRAPAPVDWVRVGLLDVIEETTGVALRGDESPAELDRAVGSLPTLADALAGGLPHPEHASAEVARLQAWTALFSSWCDRWLPPWLAARPALGVHLVDFPPPLAALAQCHRAGGDGRMLAGRFESHVHGVELANGYRELRDAHEQRRRFRVVNGLRRALGQSALPLDGGFLSDLEHVGLPACAGTALGFERLLMVACGAARLTDIDLDCNL